MESSQYRAPTSLSQAAQLLSENSNAKIMAGGTDLLVQMRMGIKQPQLIVDIKNIPELKGIELSGGALRLGAATAGVQITANDELKAVFPGLVEATDLIGSTQVQGRCSVGGNLCNSSPAADTVSSLIVNRAQCCISGPSGERKVAVEAFNTGPGQNCLANDEILVSFELPRPDPRTSDAYLRFIPRTEMDIAVAGAAVSLTFDRNGTCTHARVAIGAVAPTAKLVPAAAQALVGSTLDADALEKAAQAASDAASPISDKRGSAEYRTKVVGVLVRRAALIAKERIIAKA